MVLAALSEEEADRMTRTSSQANRERVAAALAKWFDEGAKKKPKRNGPKYTKKRIESQPKLGIK